MLLLRTNPSCQLISPVSSSPSLWCTSTSTLSPPCSTLYLPVLVDSQPVFLVPLLIVDFQGSPSSWRWWGGTSSQCSSTRTTPTLMRRRPIRKSSCPLSMCLILQILVCKPSVTMCCLTIDTLPAPCCLQYICSSLHHKLNIFGIFDPVCIGADYLPLVNTASCSLHAMKRCYDVGRKGIGNLTVMTMTHDRRPRPW